ncbi:zinc finger protein 121-like isoform X2 [Takifugu flavidus]|uniref:zinc finger protein 121-like isoform X2 n=1 Tax=Takifugu flavidus TaxID=433684 RepID=UPI00254400B8|nr:zinc finger protein 121-like isoform X2 [Takifugu flavidus]
MSSVECLRTFVMERLTVAAEEIFRVFQQKLDGYEEELDYQRRLVESVWRPHIKLHRTELSQQQTLWKEEEDDYQHQDRSCSLDQEDSKPPQIKDEQEETCCYQDGESLTVKQEMDTLMVTIHEQDDDSELGLNPDQSQEKPEVNTTVQSPVLPEPDCDLQLLSYSPHISESKDEENRTSEDSRWTTAEEPKQTMKQNHPKCQTGNVNSPAESAVDCDTDAGAKSSACNIGEQQGKLKADMTGHSTINPNDTPHVGLACGKGSRGQHSSSADDKSHTGAKLFICETCGKDFNINSALKSHIRSHTGKRLYLCKTCGKAFAGGSSLKRHIRIHTGERPYLCKTCGKAFLRGHDLIIHSRDHTGERPYVCKTCGKTFKRITILKNHFRVHTGERPYLCKTCGKAFMDRSSLKVHMRVHTGERPYLCKICGKTFLRSSDLTIHLRDHTGERPYVCKTCGKAFKVNSSLNKHMRIHSRERPHVCETCGEAFTQSCELVQHMSTHRSENIQICKQESSDIAAASSSQ